MDVAKSEERAAAVRRLMEQRLISRGSRVGKVPGALSTGLAELDAFLPHGGLLPCGLTEWVGEGAGLLAGWVLAYHGRRGKVAYVGMCGCVHPEWVEAVSGEEGVVDGYLAAQWPQRAELGWLAEQVIGSGLFGVVVIGGSTEEGDAWFDEVMWRRWMGASKRHGTVVLVLVRGHSGLGSMVCPGWGRMRVEWEEASLRVRVCLEKCAGHAPGGEMVLCVPGSGERLGEGVER